MPTGSGMPHLIVWPHGSLPVQACPGIRTALGNPFIGGLTGLFASKFGPGAAYAFDGLRTVL